MARQRDVQAHRQRLSAATWSVLAEHGLEGLTLRAVAREAGCTTGLVLHTFPDKQALLQHARHLLHERTAQDADTAQGKHAQPWRALRAVLVQGACLDEEKRQVARVWVAFAAAAMHDPALAATHQTFNRAFLHRLRTLVAATRPDFTKHRCAQTAVALVALIEGLNTLAAADPATYPPAMQLAAIEAALAPLRSGEESPRSNAQRRSRPEARR